MFKLLFTIFYNTPSVEKSKMKSKVLGNDYKYDYKHFVNKTNFFF